MSEQWKSIPGFDGAYSVSDHGRVRSEARCLTRRNGRRYRISTRILAHHDGAHASVVSLRVGLGEPKTFRVHALEMLAFVGPSDGLEVRHLNGNPNDNRLGNLAYGTKVENEGDKIGHGTSNRGERNGCSILSEPDVIEIRESKLTLGELSIKYGVGIQTIRSIQTRRRWSWLK